MGDQFVRSATLGWSTVLVFTAGLLAVLWGLWREVRSFQHLRQVDTLRTLLACARTDLSSLLVRWHWSG